MCVVHRRVCRNKLIIIIIITDLYSAFRSEDTRLNTLVYRKFELSRHAGSDQAWPWVGFIHGLGWVGSEIFAYEMGWVARN